MWQCGSRGQGVWRGEVFVWQRHRQWGGEAGEGACKECERGESFVPTVCGAGRCESVARERGRGGIEWAVWREGRAWEGRGVKREEERWGGERGQ